MLELEKPTPKRKYKDSIFVDLLTCDEKNIRQVCMSLDESIKDEPIELVKLTNTVYNGLENDVSCLVGNKLMMLMEHQSTINPNMPMRCLQYSGRMYEGTTPVADRYSEKPKKYRNPEFYTFYNGDAPYPEYSELRLSKLFIDQSRKPSLELIVKVININYTPNNKFLKKCRILYEYALLVYYIKMYRKYGTEGYDMAVNWCLKNGILKVNCKKYCPTPFLKKKGFT